MEFVPLKVITVKQFSVCLMSPIYETLVYSQFLNLHKTHAKHNSNKNRSFTV